MSNTLTIVANILAQTDKIDFVKAELEKLIEPTRLEQGCLNYDLHQDNENPAHFLFYENWQTRELWLAHMESQHLKDFIETTDGAVESVEVKEMSHVG